MLKYLKAAFWQGVEFEGLGKLPLNAMAVAGFVILGFAQPAFWLLGLGLEAAYLWVLANHERYRKLVDLRDHDPQADLRSERQRLEQRLSPASRERLQQLHGKVQRASKLLRDNAEEAFLVEHNTDALDRMEWIALKLLLARENLEQNASKGADTLDQQIASLKKELELGKLTPSLRESKEATLQVLQRRRNVLADRTNALQLIESDLQRVEAQIDLALDSAALSGPTAELSGSIDLASQLFDDSFGEASVEVSRIDHLFEQGPAQQG